MQNQLIKATFVVVKVIAFILSLIVLVATNGIAIGEHYCSILNQELPTQSSDSEDDDCCHTIYTDFIKQDIEGSITENIELDKSTYTLHQCLLFTHIDIKLSSLTELSLQRHSPPNLHLLKEIEPEQIQVFRC